MFCAYAQFIWISNLDISIPVIVLLTSPELGSCYVEVFFANACAVGALLHFLYALFHILDKLFVASWFFEVNRKWVSQ